MNEYLKKIRETMGHAPILVCDTDVIVINKKEEILLQKRIDNGMWAFPGGTIDIDDVAEDCAKRELKEETSLIANHLELFGVYSGAYMRHTYTNGDEISIVSIGYICRDYSGTPIPDNNEGDELKFFSIDNLPTQISPPATGILAEYIKYAKEKRSH